MEQTRRSEVLPSLAHRPIGWGGGAAGDGAGVEVGPDRGSSEGRGEGDAVAGVEAFVDALEGVEATEAEAVHRPDFADDGGGGGGFGDEAGVSVDLIQLPAVAGAGGAEKRLAGEEAVVFAAAFQGAVNEDVVEDGGGEGGLIRHRR